MRLNPHDPSCSSRGVERGSVSFPLQSHKFRSRFGSTQRCTRLLGFSANDSRPGSHRLSSRIRKADPLPQIPSRKPETCLDGAVQQYPTLTFHSAPPPPFELMPQPGDPNGCRSEVPHDVGGGPFPHRFRSALRLERRPGTRIGHRFLHRLACALLQHWQQVQSW